jgi:glycosyltransferase involved in cell wall biosynthesis
MDAERRSAGTTGVRAPRVSIGMPVWNGERFLRQAIDALLAQSFEDFELIICDNASTDATESVCHGYVEADNRIRYFGNDRNIGLQANFDKVLDLATGPYFMWAGHDDLWDPSYISRMVDVLDRRDSVVLAGSNAASVDQDGKLRKYVDNVTPYSPTSTYARAKRLICAPPGGWHSTLIYGLMRTPVIKRIGLVRFGEVREYNKGIYATDKLALFKLVFEGDFHVMNETLYFRRDVVEDRDRGTSRHRLAGMRSRLRQVAYRSVDVHGYFGALRTIVLSSKLTAREKTSLVLVSGVQELRFYVTYYASLVARLRF